MTPDKLALDLIGQLVTIRTSTGGEFHGRLLRNEHGNLVVRTPSGARYLYMAGCTLQPQERVPR